MTEPTDAELKAMWQPHAADIGGIFCYARAVLAKWGQPVQAAEPVAWLRNTTDPQPHAVTNLKFRSAVDSKAGVEYIPVFAAPPPVAREPLSDEEVDSLCKVGPVYAPDGKVTRTPPQYRDELEAAQRYGLRKGERAHGIKKGGQQ